MSTSTAFEPEQAALVEAALEDVNGYHADTVLFFARHLFGADLTGAEILGADPSGVDLAVQGADRRVERITFDAPAATADDVYGHLFGKLVEARAAAGDDVPLTSLEAELAETATIPVQMVELVGRRQITPNLIEVEVRGDERLTQPSPDAFYYALVCDEPGVVSERFTIEDLQAQGPDGPVSGAYYTVRSVDPSTHTALLWVVLHDHREGGRRTTGAWLADAPLGTELGMWGPREGFEPPTDAEQLLLVADETGIPAVASVIEHLPAARRIVAILEVADEACRPPLPEHRALEVRWLHRDGREAGTGHAFLDEVRALALEGEWWAFGGAESRQVTAVRKHLRNELGWPAERVFMTGYWRRSA